MLVGAQQGPEPAFGKPQSVVRCGVEIAHAASPRGIDGRRTLLIRGNAADVTKLRASQAERREGDAASDRDTFQCELPPYDVILILHHTSIGRPRRRRPRREVRMTT